MPRPTDIRLHQKSRILQVTFDDGYECHLSCEYLRISSPSAEVRGHGPGQEVLQTGKQNVGITALDPSGHYALKIHFDDGHDSGLFTWNYLYTLGKEFETRWPQYLKELKSAGKSRKPG